MINYYITPQIYIPGLVLVSTWVITALVLVDPWLRSSPFYYLSMEIYAIFGVMETNKVKCNSGFTTTMFLVPFQSYLYLHFFSNMHFYSFPNLQLVAQGLEMGP